LREAGYSRIVAPIFAHPTTFPAVIFEHMAEVWLRLNLFAAWISAN
jgi:hypothetical protein